MVTLGDHMLDLVLEDGRAVVHEYDPAAPTVARATPVRFKLSDSGGRISMDTPGVNPDLFITDDDNRIIDG